MVGPTRLRLDRIASSTRNVRLDREVLVGSDIQSREGYVLAVRVLTDKSTYDQIEIVSGRLVSLRAEDILAGTLGTRDALKGYAGSVPDTLKPGDTIQVLNMAGVLGECAASHPDLGPPFDVEVLGSVLAFPAIGDRVGEPAHIGMNAIETADTLNCSIPVVYIVGTSMSCGKTRAASEIVRGLNRAGLRVGGLKLTGVSLQRDTHAMCDAGAVAGLTFNDAGIVRTSENFVLPAARGLLNHMARIHKPDIIVAELGDGLMGEYGVSTILAQKDLMALKVAMVACAPDPVATWGAHQWLQDRFGLQPTVISGPVTDNDVGCVFVHNQLKMPAFNARRRGQELANTILESWNARN